MTETTAKTQIHIFQPTLKYWSMRHRNLNHEFLVKEADGLKVHLRSEQRTTWRVTKGIVAFSAEEVANYAHKRGHEALQINHIAEVHIIDKNLGSSPTENNSFWIVDGTYSSANGRGRVSLTSGIVTKDAASAIRLFNKRHSAQYNGLEVLAVNKRGTVDVLIIDSLFEDLQEIQRSY